MTPQEELELTEYIIDYTTKTFCLSEAQAIKMIKEMSPAFFEIYVNRIVDQGFGNQLLAA